MKRQNLAPFALAAASLALLAGGCASTTPDANAKTSAPATALVASDTLGTVLFTGALTLGPTTSPARPTFAEVPSR